jgi:hypothetical protein
MGVDLKGAVPVLPVKDVAGAVAFYQEKLGFSPASIWTIMPA